MPSFRTWWILAALALAGSGAAEARALPDSKDGLAEGDWHGEKSWRHVESGGDGTADPAPSTPTPAPSPAPEGTPTGSTGTSGPEEPEEPEEPGDPYQPDPTGSTGPTWTPPAPTPAVGACTARWVCSTKEPAPSLHEEETLLTLTLFRTDAFAFVSNGYCRSESTWYVDAFATTLAGHGGQSTFTVEVRLEQACPSCAPKIDLAGISQLQARVQAKAYWGSIDPSTTASAAASTTWAGDIDCSDRGSASIAGGQGTGEVSVGAEPLKITKKTSSSFVAVDVDGGKGDSVRIDEARTFLAILNRGSVSTFAAGTDDNVQAKCRAGYFLVIHGESACGKWGEFQVVLEE